MINNKTHRENILKRIARCKTIEKILIGVSLAVVWMGAYYMVQIAKSPTTPTRGLENNSTNYFSADYTPILERFDSRHADPSGCDGVRKW